MTKTEKIDKLKDLLAPLIEDQGAFLVEVNLRGERGSQLVEVFCDTEQGITVDKCAEISRQIMPQIDSSNVFDGSYRLEVSSPGVGTPIKDRRQYRSNIGRLLKVRYKIEDTVKEVEGDLIELKEDGIVIRAGAADLGLDFDSIVEARVKIRW